MLRDFLIDSGLGDCDVASAGGGGEGQTRRRAVAGIKTEGVLITCQSGPDSSTTSLPPAATNTTVTEAREEDELIWWAWDGKLIGFAEW
jgi:hypothetical protein